MIQADIQPVIGKKGASSEIVELCRTGKVLAVAVEKTLSLGILCCWPHKNRIINPSRSSAVHCSSQS
jgi:hypothetical protein